MNLEGMLRASLRLGLISLLASAGASAASAQCSWECSGSFHWTLEHVGIGMSSDVGLNGQLSVDNGPFFNNAVSARTFATNGIALLGNVKTGAGGGAHGVSFAVVGLNPSPFGTGVVGQVSSETGLTDGVRGESFSAEGRGVAGIAGAEWGSATGVFGSSHSTEGKGVFGHAVALDGIAVGVLGQADSDSGRGVRGLATAKNGTTVGVFGESMSPSGFGVYGSSPYIGVSGLAYNANGYGVYGANDSPGGHAGYFIGKGYFSGFLGVGRTTQVSSAEAFGIYKETNGFGGMYAQTSSSAGKPFYGYSAGGDVDAYHYFVGDQWRLYVGGERVAVTGSGNVGIGTTSPAFLLHVNGSAGKPGGGSWSVASDARLKKDIEPLGDALERLLAVRGVSFEYVDPAAISELPGRQLGVVAQEVERVFPQWVDEGADGYKRVTFRGFEALAVEALRGLRAEKDAELATLRADKDAEIAGLRAEKDAEIAGLRAEKDAQIGSLEARLSRLEQVTASLQGERSASAAPYALGR